MFYVHLRRIYTLQLLGLQLLGIQFGNYQLIFSAFEDSWDSVFSYWFLSLCPIVTRNGMLKLPTMVIDMSISPFSFIIFTFCILKLFYYKLFYYKQIHLCNFWLICLHKELAIKLLWNIPLHFLCYFLPCSPLCLIVTQPQWLPYVHWLHVIFFSILLFPNYLRLKSLSELFIDFLQFSWVVCFFGGGAVFVLTLSDNVF